MSLTFPLSPALPSLTSPSPWFVCVAVVIFDLEVGPRLEYISPIAPGALPDQTGQATAQQLIAQLSFPDTHLQSTGDTLYCFRVFSGLFGFVHFRQRRDATNARGFLQKSAIIVTRIPAFALFESCVTIIAEAYHSFGAHIMASLIHQIYSWPPPWEKAGQRVNLPLLGKLVQGIMPNRELLLENQYLSSGHFPVFSPLSLRSLSLFDSFHWTGGLVRSYGMDIIQYYWTAWELVMTGEPILIITNSPSTSAALVFTFISLISPVIYRGDYRPYFTLYDPDFKHIQSLHDSNPSRLPAIVLGITNPFFLKSLQHFPHLFNFTTATNPSSHNSNNQANAPATDSSSASSSPSSSSPPLPSSLPSSVFHSKVTPVFSPDSTVLKRLITPKAEAKEKGKQTEKDKDKQAPSDFAAIFDINNALLRRCFHDLTQIFLKPFNIFITFPPSVLQSFSAPEPAHALPYSFYPELKKFRESEFLEHLPSLLTGDFLSRFPLHSTALKSNKRLLLLGLYGRFVRSPNFYPWLNSQRELAEYQLDSRLFQLIASVASEGDDYFLGLLDGIKMALAADMKKRAINLLDKAIKRAKQQESAAAAEADSASATAELLADSLVLGPSASTPTAASMVPSPPGDGAPPVPLVRHSSAPAPADPAHIRSRSRSSSSLSASSLVSVIRHHLDLICSVIALQKHSQSTIKQEFKQLQWKENHFE